MNEVNIEILRNTFPNISADLVKEIVGMWEIHQTSKLEGLADTFASKIKDVNPFEIYNETVRYGQKLVSNLEDMGFHVLWTRKPAGLSFLTNEQLQVIRNPFIVQCKTAGAWKFQNLTASNFTFLIHQVGVGFDPSKNEPAPNQNFVRGALTPRSIFESLNLE